jgi:hypothetical protein
MGRRMENLSRRELLKLFGVTVGGSLASQAIRPLKMQAQARKVTPRGGARHVILIQGCGAMSPPDTLDLKQTKYTPDDFEPQKIGEDFYLSKAVFPNYQVWAPRAVVVRSMNENLLVHFAAQYHTQAGRALNAALLREIPAFGSVIAMELESQRRETDTFPTYMSVDLWNARCPQIGSGMLPPRFAGMDLNTTYVFDSFGGKGEGAVTTELLEQRWQALNRVAEVSPGWGPMGRKADEYKDHYQYAHKVLVDPRFKKVLDVSEEDKQRYVGNDRGQTKLGLGLLLARNILAADAGTRFIWVTNGFNGGNGGFDNHTFIYKRGYTTYNGAMPIYESGARVDRALSNLVKDLVAMPGHQPGKTMLDETMIVLAHEFGRTPHLNSAQGRDHYGHVFSMMFLGAGVKGGRVVGKTDEYCAEVLDTGWKYKEQPTMDHVVSTIYSVLGIDYSKKISNTPSGRDYEYQQTAPLGGSHFSPLSEINELFG